MNYREAKQYIEQTANKGIVLGLDTMRDLLDRMGNPQNRLSFVQAAGTNGKGSVTAYTANILAKAGYRTGRYTSPAVFSALETIQVGTKEGFLEITEEDYAAAVTRMQPVIEAMIAEGKTPPTAFELDTALAFSYFAEMGCDIAVVETGLGGDMDATNVVTTTVCALLVSISLDHQRILGSTLAEIAGHKAGIIKNGCPAVLMAQSSEVEDTVRAHCQEVQSTLRVTQPELVQIAEAGITGQRFSYGMWDDLFIPLPGTFQIENALVALEAVQCLREAGYAISDDAVRTAMAETAWPGRMQVLETAPLLLLDGAHNPDAAAKLADTLEIYFTNQQFLYIMGVLADKDYAGVVQQLDRTASRFFTLTPDNARALPAQRLAETIRSLTGKEAEAVTSMDEVLEQIRTARRENRPVIVCGSLSFLGELSARWKTWNEVEDT